METLGLKAFKYNLWLTANNPIVNKVDASFPLQFFLFNMVALSMNNLLNFETFVSGYF